MGQRDIRTLLVSGAMAALQAVERFGTVNLHAELTRDLHRELTHQRVMFGGQAWVKA